MLSNPVLKREFVTSLRTRLAFCLALAFISCLAALVMLMWPAEGVYSLAAQSSQSLFMVLSMSFLALVALCAPSFTAISITSEKERETWDMLYDTMLSPWEIVYGKMVAGVGFILILIVGSMPMMGACLILGGVSFFGDILPVYAIVCSAAVFFGLLGLWCSAIFRSSYRALIFCYLVILSICGFTWVPSIIMAGFGPAVHYLHLVRGISPFSAMLSVIYPNYFMSEHPMAPAAGSIGAIADSAWVFVAFAAFGSLVLLVMVLRAVGRPPQPKRRGTEALLDQRKDLMKRAVKFPFYLIDPRKRKRMIGSILNIIAVKEMRQKAFGRMTWVLRFVMVGFIVSMILAFLPLINLDRIGIDTINFVCLAIPLAVIILIAPVLTASCISDERESGVFDMLRSTPLTPFTFVFGKLQIAWFFAVVLVASTLPTFFILAYVNRDPTEMDNIQKGLNFIRPFNFQFSEGFEALGKVDPAFIYDMLSAFGVMGMGIVFATVVGLCASAFCRKSSTATAVSYGVVIAWAVGTLVPLILAGSLPEEAVSLSLTINPFTAAARTVSDTAIGTAGVDWVVHLYIMGGVSLVLFIATVFKVWFMMRPEK